MSDHSYCAPTRAAQRGYVLILTIAALVILALAGGYAGERISIALRLARAEQASIAAERMLNDAMARMTFVLATTPRTPLGLGSDTVGIRLDGRWYDLGNGVVVSLQDGRGLLNLRTAPRAWKENFLATYGLPPERIGMLLDTLDDYVDADSLRRLQGAEADDYARADLIPPRNDELTALTELARVHGWRAEAALWSADSPVTENLVFYPGSGVNPATATWRVLVATLGMSERQAKDFIEKRGIDAATLDALVAPYAGLRQASDLLRVDRPIVYPGPVTVVTVAMKEGGHALRGTLTITPASRQHAWTFNDVRHFHLASVLPEALPALPDVSAFAANLDQEISRSPF